MHEGSLDLPHGGGDDLEPLAFKCAGVPYEGRRLERVRVATPASFGEEAIHVDREQHVR